MKIPIDTSKFYPTKSEQYETLFRKNDKIIWNLKIKFDSLRIKSSISNRELQREIAKFLYNQMYIYHELKIIKDPRSLAQLGDAFYRCVRPNEEHAFEIFFPETNRRISTELKYKAMLYAGNLSQHRSTNQIGKVYESEEEATSSDEEYICIN